VQRNEVYVQDTGDEYDAQPPEVGRVPGPSRRATVEDYEESLTDSDSIPIRYPVQEPQTHFAHRAPSHSSFRPPTEFEQRAPSHSSFRGPEEFEQRVPSHSSFPQETMPQPSLGPPPSAFVAPPPGEVYLEEPPTSMGHDNGPEYVQEPPVIQAEPRRFRARRGEPITVGNMRIEVEDDGRHSRSHRGRRSRSRSAGTYSSRVSFRYEHVQLFRLDSLRCQSSGSYTSSSVEEQPIIISADPHTEIEVRTVQKRQRPHPNVLTGRRLATSGTDSSRTNSTWQIGKQDVELEGIITGGHRKRRST